MSTSTKPETSSDFTLSLTESAAKRVREIIEQAFFDDTRIINQTAFYAAY